MRLVWSGDSSLFHRAGEDESWSFFARPAGALFIGGAGFIALREFFGTR